MKKEKTDMLGHSNYDVWTNYIPVEGKLLIPW